MPHRARFRRGKYRTALYRNEHTPTNPHCGSSNTRHTSFRYFAASLCCLVFGMSSSHHPATASPPCQPPNFLLDDIPTINYLAPNAVAVPKNTLETRCYIRDPSCVGTFSNKIKHCVGV